MLCVSCLDFQNLLCYQHTSLFLLWFRILFSTPPPFLYLEAQESRVAWDDFLGYSKLKEVRIRP